MVTADFIVGIIGSISNIVSIISFGSSIGAFRQIVKKKSSENYKGVPYVTTLVSTSLWTLYGALDPDDGILIVTVNAVGVASQAAYLFLFLFYASKERKVKYLGFVVVDLVFVGIVIAITLGVFHGNSRRTFIGVLCAAFTIAMYAAPLSAVRNVVGTKSVEYMPFWLSFSLVVNATVWFSFAILLKDYYVLLIVYFMYKNKSPSSHQFCDKVAAQDHDLEQGKQSMHVAGKT
ncbi:hypothetical protein C2S52_019951 [Perilla frutescens var. hirtella]|nr:hypothetical protein C2S52_019951 [Perilla frutescens var. hirtella]KAH6805824.1 hypothetical protein C2S51_030655 [Perilla frutescens var. frutescens]